MKRAPFIILLGFLHTAVSDECANDEIPSFATDDSERFDVNCVTAQVGDVVCYDIFDRGNIAADFKVVHRRGTCDNPDLQSFMETCQGQAESKCKVCNPYEVAVPDSCVIITCENDQFDCTLSYRVSLNEDTACRMQQDIDLRNDGSQAIYITDACAERPKVCVSVTSEEVVASSFEVNMYANCNVDMSSQRRVRDDAGGDDVMCFADVAEGDCLQIQCNNVASDCDLKINIGDENFNSAGCLRASISLTVALMSMAMLMKR